MWCFSYHNNNLHLQLHIQCSLWGICEKIQLHLALQKLSHTFTKIEHKALQANKTHILLAFMIVFFGGFCYSQEPSKKQQLRIAAEKDSIATGREAPINNTVIETTATDSTAVDSVTPPPELLLDKIQYSADGYRKINRREKKMYLYDNAFITYQDTELKSGIIVLDFEKNEVYAGRIKDSAGNYTQYPYFKQGANIVEPDSMRFNYDTKKALIWNSKSEQAVGGGINVFAETTKKENDSVYFFREGRLTTSDHPEDPEYYIRIRKAKFVPKKKIIAGLSNMYIADVPTPIGVPFAYFPLTQERKSGFIFPTFGEVSNRGYFVQNGGYYFAVSDYFDLALLGDYYTNGSYGLRAETSYSVRYKFKGSLAFRFENLINSQRGFPDYSRSTVYNIRWSHSQDAKSSPNSRFSASVNLGSSQYYQLSYNQLNTPNFLNNTLASSISYSKTFPAYPEVNINLTATHSQNTNTESINMTLPTLQASLERIFPFAPREGIKKGIFQNINFQYNLRAENRIETTDSLFFKKEMFDDAQVGFRHSIPISTNFKIFKYLSMSLSANYDDVWYLETIRRNNYDTELNEVTVDTISGFDRFNQYNFSASLGTTLYGTFNFGDDKRIQAIRHVMRPSISYGYNPGFDQFYDEYIASADTEDVEQYTRFEGGIYGVPGRSNSNSIGFSLSNTLEAKVRDRDTTATEPKKITLLNNLNFSGSYNIAADSLAWSPIRISGGTQLFKNKMSVNFGATIDPYALDNNGNRIDVFNIDNGGSLFRLTGANMNVSYSFSSKNFEGDGSSTVDNTESGGRQDDLFGKAQDFSDSRTFADRDNSGEDKTENTTNYRTKLPWDLRLAYSLTYSNSRRQSEISANSLMFSGNIDLSPRWQVGVSSGYDFRNKGFTFTQLRFERDLESWRMSFNWVPFSSRSSWYFFIGIKSSVLSDIKWDKRREPDRNL